MWSGCLSKFDVIAYVIAMLRYLLGYCTTIKIATDL